LPSAAEVTVVVAACAVVVACAAAEVACAGAEVDFVVAGASAVVVSAALDFETALTAALDSEGASGSFRSMDFTVAMDITIPSSTIPILITQVIPIRIRTDTRAQMVTLRADPA
jgi:hypothetical protein